MRALLLLVGFGAVAAGCGQETRFFAGAPIPPMTALTCDLKVVHSGGLNPTYQRQKADDALEFTVVELNDRKGTARLIGNQQTELVRFERGGSQLRFIELTALGNMTTLSVFNPPEDGAPLPAVHSRHIQIAPGNIAISQYAGSCNPKL